MKKIFLILAFIVFSNLLSFSQTKLILLGSAHTESYNLSLNTYERLIDSIKPDVILFELDSTDMTPNFQFKKVMLDFIAKSRNDKGLQSFFEISAVNNYFKKNPEVIVRPYDITNRDSYYYKNNYHQNQAALDILLNKINNKDSISIENNIILNYYFKLEEIDSLMTQADIRTLNSETYDEIVSHSFEWKEKNLIKLIKSTNSLKKFENHILFEYSFWRQRNEAMIQNILKFITLYKNKKILIVTGAYHRYYFKKSLNPLQNKLKFTLKEYYEE